MVLDYSNYVNKILTNFENDENLTQMEPDITHGKTKSIEIKFQKCWLKLVKDKVVFVDIYKWL